MTKPSFRPMLQQLSDGVLNCACLDDPELLLKQIFVQLALAFNNEEVEVVLPDEAYNSENIDLINPNNIVRIVISIRCMIL